MQVCERENKSDTNSSTNKMNKKLTYSSTHQFVFKTVVAIFFNASPSFQLPPYSKPHIPAPSIQTLPKLLMPLKGHSTFPCICLPKSTLRPMMSAPFIKFAKFLGTTTVELTQHQSMHVIITHICPSFKKNIHLDPSTAGFTCADIGMVSSYKRNT